MAKTDEQKKKELVAFLARGFRRWQRDRENEGIPMSENSQNEFCAVELGGIPPTSFSGWLTKARLPGRANAYLLAQSEYLGPEIYDILDYEPLVPEDPHARYILLNWYKLSREDRQRIYEETRKGVENPNTTANTAPAAA